MDEEKVRSVNESAKPASEPGQKLAFELFWVEVARRAVRLAQGEQLHESERDALEVAERALNFVSDNYNLRRQVVAAGAVQAIAEGADHI